MTVGNTIIETPFAWRCRRHEIQLAYSGVLDELSKRSDTLTIHQTPPILERNACTTMKERFRPQLRTPMTAIGPSTTPDLYLTLPTS
jgi:hypothetical protein